MDVIRFECPRCGKHLRVSPEKAGRHGRCPTCGGRIKIPGEEAVEHIEEPQHHYGRALAGVVLGLVLIGAAWLAWRRGEQKAAEAEQRTVTVDMTLLEKRLKQVRERLVQMDEVEDRFGDYMKLLLAENRLRARDIRTRLNRYEPVSIYECALRERVVESQERRASEEGAGAAVTRADWRLNSPLTEMEKDHLKMLSDQMEAKSAEIVEALKRVRVVVRIEADPLGRRLLDPLEIRRRIDRERGLLREAEADTRNQMMGGART